MQRIDEQLTGTERSKGKSQLSKCYPLNVPDSPHEAMEFLSRSWSPSSSNFFQILSTNVCSYLSIFSNYLFIQDCLIIPRDPVEYKWSRRYRFITNKLRILTTAQSVMHCYRPGSKTGFPQIKQLVHIKKCILHFYTNLNCSLGKGRECNFKSLFFSTESCYITWK